KRLCRMTIIRYAVKRIANFGLVMKGERQSMKMLVSVAAELLNDARTRTNQEEMPAGYAESINNRQRQNGNTNSRNCRRRILGFERWPNRRQPRRWRLAAKHVIHQPFDRPRLQKFNARR